MSYEKHAYVPSVLLGSFPELRAPLRGSGIQGEALAWPFAEGGLLLLAARGSLSDGLYPLYLGEDPALPLPELLFQGGFAFAVTRTAQTMEQLYGRQLRLGPNIAAGQFALL